MKSHHLTRRNFIKGSIAVATLPSQTVFAQTTNVRLEWQAFKADPIRYQAYVNAIRLMRSNTNASDQRSWNYWINCHVNFCPHNVSYFLAWHRGLLYYFEQALRQVSGVSTMTAPYWDYYRFPNMPSEFTDPSSPLFVPNRVNTNLYSALGMAPFASSLVVFPRGVTDSFERQIEGRPHNPIHNLIGGYMALRTSPTDPIFWLHHSNVDRLWVAWVAAGAGRQMPPSGDPYWTGSFSYSSSLTMNRSQTMDTTGLGYRYDNQSMPSGLPPRTANATSAKIVRVQLRPGQGRPAVGNFAISPPRALPGGRRALGGAREIGLDDGSLSAEIPIQVQDRTALRSVVDSLLAPPTSPQPGVPYRSVQVILDDVRVTGAGRNGGYYFNIYLQLPEGMPPLPEDEYFLGTIGPFEIDSAMHHGNSATLSFPATDVLSNLTNRELSAITLSFVRVSGDNAPRGRVITIGEARVELSPSLTE